MKALCAALALLVVTTGLLASVPARAQDAAPMTDTHISRIRNNCQSALATLSQLHANDGPVFVNRNQTYFSISDKLIARLNARLAVNRYDTSSLVNISNDYNEALTDFRTAFKEYDSAMKELVRMDCGRQPVGFYDKVDDVQELRGKVNASIKKLHTVIDQYRQAVATFEQVHLAQSKVKTND